MTIALQASINRATGECVVPSGRIPSIRAAETDVVLIVAVSARALVQAARRAGWVAVAIDAFGDDDARAACAALTVAPHAANGFAAVDVDALVGPLVRDHAPKGIVYGSGFDDCPQQVRRLANHAPLLGASAQTLIDAKTPARFAELCAATNVRHPEISATPPPDPAAWLLKRAGGSGGLHVRSGLATPEPGDYWQRRIEGRSVSLLFTFNGSDLAALGWSEQWTAPDVEAPYRYGGAVGPLCPPPNVPEGLAALAARLGLRGLASADFLDDGEHLWLLEINARPGATLDVFDNEADPLLRRHIEAVAGLASTPRALANPRASAIVYAKNPVVVRRRAWPEWVSDRPTPGAVTPAGAPLCTVHADASSVSEAKIVLFERMRWVQDYAEGIAA